MNTYVEIVTMVMPRPGGGISVLFGPRFHSGGRLRDYPDWRNWPAHIMANIPTSADLLMASGQTNTFSITPTGVLPDSNVWKALFGVPDPNINLDTTVAVNRYQMTDRSSGDFRSFLGTDALDAIEAFYRDLAISHPEVVPTGSDVKGGLFNAAATQGQNLRSFLEPLVPNAPAQPASYPDSPHVDNPQHKRWSMGQMMAMARNHPHLMRLLGLVIDFDGGPPAPATGQAYAAFSVSVPSVSNGNHTRLAIPIGTALEPDSFAALAPTTGLFRQTDGGFLHMGQWALSTIDYAGAAAQTASWGRSIADTRATPAPPVHSQGISLIAKAPINNFMQDSFARQMALHNGVRGFVSGAGAPPIIDRGHLTVGWRIDVRDRSVPNPQWRSLFERIPLNNYAFPFASVPGLTVPADEGWAALVLTTDVWDNATRPNPGTPQEPVAFVPNAPQRVSDVLHVWDGWSGAAPRPGRVVNENAEMVVPDQNQNPPNPADRPQVEVDYRPVAGTLPQLRYGHDYQFRARAVDAMGNSQPLSGSEPQGARSDIVTYGRTHPIGAPTPVRIEERPLPGVGDLTSTLVIKSDLGQNNGSVIPTERLFFPPPTNQLTCERHGVPGDGDDASAFGELAARDAASIQDQTWPDPVSDELIAEAGSFNGAQATIGFLSDPAVGELALSGLPGGAGTVLTPFGGTWPQKLSTRLVMQAGGAAPTASNGLVTVEVPKAIQTVVEVSCSPTDPTDFYIRNLADDPAVDAAVASGRSWMTSSRSTIRLVHAVRQPLTVPVPKPISTTRPLVRRSDGTIDPTTNGLGSLRATFSVEVKNDAHSTGRVKVSGTWTDPIDDGPGAPPPGTRTTSGEIGSLNVGYFDSDLVVGTDMSLDMFDTKAHDVEQTVEAFSRYSEYFTEAKYRVTMRAAGVILDSRGVVPESVEVRHPNGSIFPRDSYTVDGKSGRLTPVAGGPLINDQAEEVSYVPLPVNRLSTEGGTAGPITVVPASRAPDTPEVLEVLPSVARDVRVVDGAIRIRHSGQVLRLHIARPWYTSGRKEQLALILDGALKTEIGRDPIFAGDGLRNGTRLGDWRRAVDEGTFDGVLTSGHDAIFDAARDVWVCDIELDGDYGYRPFLRPVVGRLQPDALPGAHLSPTFALDPHRLGVYRETQVRPGQSSVKATVVGPDNEGVLIAGVTHHNEVTARLQVKEAGVTDPDLAWMDEGDSVTFTRTERGDGWSSWTGKIPYPSRSGPYRLVLEETEPSKRITGNIGVARDAIFVETVEL